MLQNSVFYPRYGEFETTDEQRQRCKNIHKNADLAVIPNEIWNKVCNIKKATKKTLLSAEIVIIIIFFVKRKQPKLYHIMEYHTG